MHNDRNKKQTHSRHDNDFNSVVMHQVAKRLIAHDCFAMSTNELVLLNPAEDTWRDKTH